MELIKSPKFNRQVFTCGDGLRFATPQIVARYRARRLKTGVLADISCGIGGQTIFFAKECGCVYGVDIDGAKLECARKNAALYGVDNITFIEGDALDPRTIGQVSSADIIFSDPSRPAAEAERQTLNLRPGIPQVLEAYRGVTGRIAFEAPPQMPPQRIDFDCETEYISLDGQLNRLTLYFGPLKEVQCSAVILKGDEIFRLGSSGPAHKIDEAEELLNFVYEPDPAVVKAGLLERLVFELDHDIALVNIDQKRILLTSEIFLDSPFFKNRYRVVDEVPVDLKVLNRVLKKNDVGRALIRFGISPPEYWEVRNRIEQGLTGKRAVHLYKIAGAFYVLEPFI